MAVTFEREALYLEVWQTPLTKLGPKYGLSDNGLRKVCKALQIPLPPVGHWARIAAGHAIEATPLPALSDAAKTTFYSEPDRHRTSSDGSTPEQLDADDRWLKARHAVDASISAAMIASADCSAVMDSARRALERAQQAKVKREAQDEKELQARQARGSRWSPPNGLNFEWRQPAKYINNLAQFDEKAMSVSPVCAERAISVLDALCRGAVARGFALKAQGPGVDLKLDGSTFRAVCREKFEAGRAPPAERVVGREVSVGTGKLILEFKGVGNSPVQITDDDRGRLEEKLATGYVFQRLYSRIVLAWQQKREAEEEARQWRLRTAAAEEERRIAEQRRQLELEEQRIREAREQLLAEEAALWGRVLQLRGYIAAVRAGAGDSPSSELSAWLEWAEHQIAAADPVADRLAGRPTLAECELKAKTQRR